MLEDDCEVLENGFKDAEEEAAKNEREPADCLSLLDRQQFA